MRAKYVLNEVLVGLWRNVTMTVAMIITLAVSLTMLAASVLMYMQVNAMKDFYYGEIEVSIFLSEDVTPAQRTSLDLALKSNPLVLETVYESREEAFKKFQELWKDSPDLVKAVQPNQLPESFRVKLKDPEKYQTFAQQIDGQQGIQDIVDQRQLLVKVFNIFNSVQLLSLIIASVMAVAALLLVGNTIQVAAYSKRREVAVMKLVGASNWFIQAPFVLEAIVAGVLGSVLGFIALFVFTKFLIGGRLQALTNVIGDIPDSNLWLQLPLMAGVGALVSAVTAWTTLRFYLRV
jgi:cell division transport system permease protein